jgi:hypothetical protein
MYTFTDMTKSTVDKYKSQTSDSSLIIINDSMSQTVTSEMDDPLLLSPLSPVGNEFSQKELEEEEEEDEEVEKEEQKDKITGKFSSSVSHCSACHTPLEPNHKRICIYVQKRKEIQCDGQCTWILCPVYKAKLKEAMKNERDSKKKEERKRKQLKEHKSKCQAKPKKSISDELECLSPRSFKEETEDLVGDRVRNLQNKRQGQMKSTTNKRSRLTINQESEVEEDKYTSSALEIKLAAFDNTVLPAKPQRNDFECIQNELKQHNERIKILEKGIHMLVDKLKTNQ